MHLWRRSDGGKGATGRSRCHRASAVRDGMGERQNGEAMTKQPEPIHLNGIRIPIDRKIMSEKMISLMRNGDYEAEEASQVPAVVQPGERIVELGAGVGYISALAGKQKGVQSISVYEANPDLIPIIEQTHALNDVKAKVRNAVVLPRKTHDTMPFYIRRDFWASSLSADTYGYERTVDVPIVSFADVLKEEAPTMLIIDIEGGELSLLDDVPLTGVRKVLIEVHQAVIGRIGMKRIFDFFSSRDFHYDQWHSHHAVVLFSHVLR